MITEHVAVNDFRMKICFDVSEREGIVTNWDFDRKSLGQKSIKLREKSCVQETR